MHRQSLRCLYFSHHSQRDGSCCSSFRTLITLENEAQMRQEFINPLFKALGWDVYNEQGYAEAYKDVIHEDAVKVGGVTKAPDSGIALLTSGLTTHIIDFTKQRCTI